MGKKKVKGRGKEKMEKKMEKKSSKLMKQEADAAGEEEIEKMIKKFEKTSVASGNVVEEVMSTPPSPRVNATLVAHPTKPELILFGGEFFRGDTCFVYDELYRYNIAKNEWKKITSPVRPPPRCSHQAVVGYKNYMYIFGGEFTSPSQMQFYHYKDIWRLDLDTNLWEKLDVKGGPTARSGHRMALWKNYIICFGGFYETDYSEPRYFNDVWMFDCNTSTWKEIKMMMQSKMGPTPRSGVQLAIYNNILYVYGGYSKEKVGGKKGGGDMKGIIHTDMYALDLTRETAIAWDKVKQGSIVPSPRISASTCIDKKRMIMFGGVYDVESENDENLESTFFNELWFFQMEIRKWFPVKLTGKKPAKENKKKKNDEDSDEEDEVEDEDSEDKKEKTTDSNNNNEPDDTTPCPRIKPLMAVVDNTLYLYGGSYESGDMEVTLNDFYSINLKKMDTFQVLYKSENPIEWIAENSESEDEEEDEEEEEDENEEEAEGDEDEDEEGEEEEDDEEVIAERKARLQEVKKKLKKIATKIETLHIPVIDLAKDKTIRDYYKRTESFWMEQAKDQSSAASEKEMRRDAFKLAEGWYSDVSPIMQEYETLKKYDE